MTSSGIRSRLRRMMIRSLLITAMICLAVSSVPVTSSAASSKKNSVRVVTTQDYKCIQQTLIQVNRERTKRGLNKLKLDKELTDAAVQRAAEIGVYIPSTSPHRRPNGKLVKSLNKRIDYECCQESDLRGENGLGRGWDGYMAVEYWMVSPPHKRGILLEGAKSIGIAYVTTNGHDLNCVLEISKTSAKKKITKKSGKVTSIRTVYAKSKYLKKSFFGLNCGNDYNGIYQGETSQITVFICSKHMADFNATKLAAADFSFRSSDPSVLSVDSRGMLTGISPGMARITATKKNDPKKQFSILLEVIAPSSETYESYEDFINEY